MRSVEVSMGGEGHPENYQVAFIDDEVGDGMAEPLFTAETPCLCGLAAATAAWLSGASEERTQAAFIHDH